MTTGVYFFQDVSSQIDQNPNKIFHGAGQTGFQVHMDEQMSKIPKTILKKKNKIEGLAQPDIKNYYTV